MSLNSFAFLLAFLPVIAIIAHLVRIRWGPTAAQLTVLTASLLFYARSGVTAVPVLAISVLWNWISGVTIAKQATGSVARRRSLAIAIAGNLLLLSAFKYPGFMRILWSMVGASDSPQASAGTILPLGITFFTLTQIMYLVDVFEGLQRPSSLRHHALFISFFPTITAGPLLRAKKFMAQVTSIGDSSSVDARLVRGIPLLLMGLFKKVVLAGSLAFVADAGFGSPAQLSGVEAWLTALSYTFQLYFDFSGYSDMAFGAALIMGVEVVANFNAPFRAATISAFWQRWHISLSSFITTYLYTPLLRLAHRPTVRTSAVATFLAMSITGLLHGATLTFLAFYVLHGAALALYQFWKTFKRPLPAGLDVAVTFLFATFTIVVFRSPSLGAASDIISQMIAPAHWGGIALLASKIAPADWAAIALPCLAAPVLAFVGPTSNELADRVRLSSTLALCTGAVGATCLLYMLSGAGGGFIYRAF